MAGLKAMPILINSALAHPLLSTHLHGVPWSGERRVQLEFRSLNPSVVIAFIESRSEDVGA